MKVAQTGALNGTAQSTTKHDGRSETVADRRYKIADPSAIVHLSSQATRSVESNGARVDFTNTEPREMKRVAKEMWREGKIDLDQLFYLENMGVPLGKEGPQGQFVPLTADEKATYEATPFDYIAGIESHLEFLRQSSMENNPLSGFATWKGLLDVLRGLQ
jgi:hypothetical protein